MSQPVCATCRHSREPEAKFREKYVECAREPVQITAFNGRPIGGFLLMEPGQCCSQYEGSRPQPAPEPKIEAAVVPVSNKVLSVDPQAAPLSRKLPRK